MYTFRYLAGILAFALISMLGHAQSLPLKNVTQSQFEDLVGDLSTDFMHTTVMGAESLGNILGWEVGVVASTTHTPHLDNLANQADPGASANHVPGASLIGLLTVPFGLTAEVGVLPKVGSNNFRMSNLSAGIKWTPTDVFGSLPVNLAAKVSLTKSTLNYDQTIQNVPTTFDYDNTVTAAEVLVSKNFAVVEPYVGVGYAHGRGNLTATGSTTVFDQTFTQSNSASGDKSGGLWLAGVELKLLVVKLGAEYTNMLGASRFTGKLSFYF